MQLPFSTNYILYKSDHLSPSEYTVSSFLSTMKLYDSLLRFETVATERRLEMKKSHF